MRGGVVLYAAQENPQIDTATAEKGRFRMKTKLAPFQGQPQTARQHLWPAPQKTPQNLQKLATLENIDLVTIIGKGHDGREV